MSNAALSAGDVRQLEDCVAGGGVAVFPADTVYGLCCDPDDAEAARRLYELKRRPAQQPAAVMFFALARAQAALAELGEAERRALAALLPGPVTLLVDNRARRYAPACAGRPGTLGLRVPLLPERLRALEAIARPVMQSSANLSGQPDARRLADVPASVRAGADLVLDGGQLPGTPSTVVDLREYERSRRWRVVRAGALAEADVARVLAAAD